MHISYGELVRTMPEGIRMLGFSYSQADDSAEAIIWTECVLTKGYELLEDAAAAANGAKPNVLSCRSEGTATVLNIGGRPLFAFAARAADLAIANAGQGTGSVIRIVDGLGTNACAYMAFRIARGGNDAVIAAASAGSGAPAGAVDLYLMPSGDKWLGMARNVAAADIVGTLTVLGFPQGDDTGKALAAKNVVVWASKAPEHAVAPSSFWKKARVLASVEVIDVEERLDSALRKGLEVEPRRHRILSGLTVKIRMPSSERSRAQAG